MRIVTFANVASLGAASGRRDDLVAHLTRRSDVLRTLGCLGYEVGVSSEQPDTVFVVEFWTSAEAHRASLDDSDVRESIATARPLLSGSFDSFHFAIVGSPLRD